MITLVSRDRVSWGVNSKKGFNKFTSIEQAAEYLVSKLNVSDDEIDKALIDMYAYNMPVAKFTTDGQFHSSAEEA